MAKRKKRTSKSKKAVKASTHTLPEGFWPQVGAVVLVVLALLLALGIFGSGGAFPLATYDAGKALFGWAVFILPFLFVYRAIQIFQAEHNKVPGVVTGATILFIVVSSGFVQLMQVNPTAFSTTHEDGGIVGIL